jgi:hypothetical protein
MEEKRKSGRRIGEEWEEEECARQVLTVLKENAAVGATDRRIIQALQKRGGANEYSTLWLSWGHLLGAGTHRSAVSRSTRLQAARWKREHSIAVQVEAKRRLEVLSGFVAKSGVGGVGGVVM